MYRKHLLGIKRIVITNKEQKEIFFKFLDTLNEAQIRWFLGREAMLFGYGGIKKMCELTGISKPTVIRGIKELKAKRVLRNEDDKIRRPGAGRKKVEEKNPEILNMLGDIVNETTANDSACILKWTTKSTYQISDQLRKMGYSISEDTIQRRLKEMNFSLQSSVRKGDGILSREYDNQFHHINDLAKEYIYEGNPVIAVDTRKRIRKGILRDHAKRLECRNASKQIPVPKPQDAVNSALIPHGVYNIQKNNDMANIGMSRNSVEFTVESIRRWWLFFGSKQYPHAKGILICMDGKENNGLRTREWKYYLQKLSDETDFSITVCYYPPGIIKWNKIEYNTISFMSMNWREEPFINLETIINVIGSPVMKKGLKMKSLLDKTNVRRDERIPDYQIKELNEEPYNTDKQLHFVVMPHK
ncbi:MAG: ISAzo13 family transposase [wastewater metagenome]|nr:ISAzo13 family transposase [Candidatus Loosdrechtia aerotolerans]